MTCIVGLVKNKTVYIGGDSAGVMGLSVQVRKDPKVFLLGEFGFGFTSSFRMGQILQYSFKPPRHNKNVSIDKYMRTVFVDALRECFSDKGFARSSGGEESGGTFLVGYRGHLFCVDNDYQVGQMEDSFIAVGCGSDLAIGALYATSYFDDLKPEDRVKIALEASSRFNGGVCPPFNLIKVRGKR